jgi:two-component system OmpR family sensor kinase
MGMTHSCAGAYCGSCWRRSASPPSPSRSLPHRAGDADEIFDYHMQMVVAAIDAPLSNVEARSAVDDAAENNELVVQVWTPDGVQSFRSVSRERLPQRAVLGFSHVKANGKTYRIFSVQTSAQTVQVAQDMAVRRNMAGSLALHAGPIAVMMLILMLVVVVVSVAGPVRGCASR